MGYVDEMADRLTAQGWELTTSETESGAVELEGTRASDEGRETLTALAVPPSAEEVTVRHVWSLRRRARRADADRRTLAAGAPLTEAATAATDEWDVAVLDRPEDEADEAETDPADAFATRTVWPAVLCGTLVAFLALSSVDSSSLRVGLWLGLTVVQAVGLYRDAGRLHRETGWPALRGWHYVAGTLVPIIDFVTVLAYLLARAEVQYYGATPLSLARGRTVARRLWNQPRAVASDLYVALGVAVTAVLLPWLLFLGPVSTQIREESALARVVVLLFFGAPVVVWYYRRYSPPSRKRAIDHGLRDLSIRVLAPFGVLGVLVVLGPVLLLVAIGIGLAVSPLIGDPTAAAVALGLFSAVFFVPIAVVMVLPLRLLPWVRAAPVVARESLNAVADRFGTVIPQRSGGGDGPLVPVQGHDHTAVEVGTTTELDTSGTFGYLPRDVQSLQPDVTPWSLRTGAVLAVPGLVYATAVFTAVERYPERTAAYASALPAEDIVLLVLSYVGVPAVVAREALAQLQLPPETLSLGFIGGLVPAVLLVPAAWHFALAYESLLYRLLQLLGNRNHLLVLWAIHVVPVVPLFALYRWLAGREGRGGQLRRSTPDSD